MLGLVNHLAQPTDIEPPPLVALYHIIKVIQGPVGTLFDPPSIESAHGNLVSGAPIAPSPESTAVLAVVMAIALLLGLTWTYPYRPSADGCAQGIKGMLGSGSVGEVDEAVAWVPCADGVDRDVDIF